MTTTATITPAFWFNVTTSSPAEIDTALAEIWGRFYAVQALMAREVRYAEYAERCLDPTYRYYNQYDVESATSATKALAKHQDKIEALGIQGTEILKETAPFNAEYVRRGGWTRAFLVDNGTGHIHTSTACSTCFSTTQFAWLPQVSGEPEESIVEQAGEGACTVCYPSAPVDVLKRKRTLDTLANIAAREAREAEKAALTAAKVAKGLTADGSPLVVRWERPDTRWARNGEQGDANGRVAYTRRDSKEFRTERGAEIWLVDSLAGTNYDRPTDGAVDEVLEAVAAKRGVTVAEVTQSMAAKVAKKRSNR